jgi:hypothetical protein
VQGTIEQRTGYHYMEKLCIWERPYRKNEKFELLWRRSRSGEGKYFLSVGVMRKE